MGLAVTMTSHLHALGAMPAGPDGRRRLGSLDRRSGLSRGLQLDHRRRCTCVQAEHKSKSLRAVGACSSTGWRCTATRQALC